MRRWIYDGTVRSSSGFFSPFPGKLLTDIFPQERGVSPLCEERVLSFLWKTMGKTP
jgi:hypothetical protein